MHTDSTERQDPSSSGGPAEITPLSQARDNSGLLQLHIAEYNALTTRGTYRIYLQSMLWPLLAIALALVVQVAQGAQAGQGPKPFSPQMLAWGTAFVVQIIVFNFYAFLIELYRDILYVERELRPLVERIVGESPFWKYEWWLKGQRGGGAMWWEYATIGVSAAALVLAGGLRLPWSLGDYIGVTVNLVVILGTARLAWQSASLRKRFFGAG